MRAQARVLTIPNLCIQALRADVRTNLKGLQKTCCNKRLSGRCMSIDEHTRNHTLVILQNVQDR